MLIWKKILWLRERVQDQREFMSLHGDDLAGYIAYYGDPGVVPLDKTGKPQTVLIPEDKPEITDGLLPVPGQDHLFYKPHYGDGGTLIYQTDLDRLRSWEQELRHLETTFPSARIKADEHSRQETPRTPTPEQLATGAHQALDHFVSLGLACGGDKTDEKVVDLLSALRHLCDWFGLSWEQLLRKSTEIYYSDLRAQEKSQVK